MSLLAIVPAKHNSKRLPGKNYALIGGKSLVQHTTDYLRTCREAGVALHIVLATDTEEMCERTEGYDHAVVSPALGRAVLDVQAVVERHRHDHSLVGMFLPTAPLRKIEYLEHCVLYTTQGYDGAITVTPFDFPPQLAITGYGKDHLDLHFPLQYTTDDTRTQDQRVYYRPNGMCYVANMAQFRRSGNFFSGKVRGVVVPQRDMIDIDYQEDLDAARVRMENWSIV